MLIGRLCFLFIIVVYVMGAGRKDYSHIILLFTVFNNTPFLVCNSFLSLTPLSSFSPFCIFCPQERLHTADTYWYRRFLRTPIEIVCHDNSGSHFSFYFLPLPLKRCFQRTLCYKGILHKCLKFFCTHPEPYPIRNHTYTKPHLLQSLNSLHETY